MKHWIRKLAALALSAAVLSGAVSAAGVLHESTLQVADSLQLTASALDQEETVTEKILTYTPGGDIRPVVVYGTTLYGRSNMDYINKYVQEQGYTAAAAVNGSFFEMRNGIPLGSIVTDGILRCTGTTYSLGIFADGTMALGIPGITMTLTANGTDTVIHYNKTLTKTNGMILYSGDYDYKTRHTVSADHLILAPETDTLTIGSTVRARVTAKVSGAKTVEIPEGGFVLSVAAGGTLPQVKTGDTVTISVTAHEAWKDAVYLVGGGDMLVENGKALTKFTLNGADRPAARTAVGLTADGNVIFYTADHGDVSAGLTLSELADRMLELGCVSALNLDGGGSTTLGATLPGGTDFVTMNRPEDGQQRTCANYIFFVRPTEPSDTAAKLFVYPFDRAVLRNGRLEMTVLAADSAYMAAAVPEKLTWSASGGTMVGNVFTASTVGTAEIRVSSGKLRGSVTVQVVETPSEMLVRRADRQKALEQLTMACGDTLDLTAQAWYLGAELAAQDTSFHWETTIGTVTRDGVFTAPDTPGAGELTVSCGDLSVTIPVDVQENPFADLDRHWARMDILDMYFAGILKGSENKQGELVYRPNDSMTRQEFIVALMRYLEVDVSQYAYVQLPFTDTNRIASWALNATKAAYALEYVTGSDDGTGLKAKPTSTISRQEAMTILARTQEASSDADVLKAFTDSKDVAEWAEPYVTAMVEWGIIQGADGKLSPKASVTRAQMAKMLCALKDFG